MDTPEAEQALIQAFQHEENEKVRASALETFSNMKPTREGIVWARSELFAVSRSDEQAALVDALGRNLPAHPWQRKGPPRDAGDRPAA